MNYLNCIRIVKLIKNKDLNTYKAVGYHGTENADIILKKGIDYKRLAGDVFLGRGFYLWRDSYNRAFNWQERKQDVIRVEIKCSNDEILNFTSSNFNSEKEIIRIYLKYFKPKNIYFGEFIDFLIDELKIDIKLVTIMDLKDKITKLHIQDPNIDKNKTIFSYGDIQICLKNNEALNCEPIKVENEN